MTLKMVEDILLQLDNIGKDSNLVSFLMPWDFSIKEFESESEYRCRLWEEEKSKESDLRFGAFENKMEKKHSDLVVNLERWSQSIVNLIRNGQGQNMSYANALSGFNAGYIPVYPNVPASNAKQPTVNANSVPRNNIPDRSRSNSKRRRNEDGSFTEVVHQANDNNKQHQDHAKGGSKSAKKAVLGTSNSSVTGRKMRTSPADIFVWGVHRDTSIQDIIKDLEDSDI